MSNPSSSPPQIQAVTPGIQGSGSAAGIDGLSDGTPGNRLEWIDVLKGLCIVLVVQHHFIKFVLPIPITPDAAGAAHLVAQLWIWFDAALGPIRMPLFFFLSGMLIRNSLNRKHQTGQRQKRIDNLIWVYVVFSSIQWLSANAAHLVAGTHHLTPLAVDAIYARSFADFFSGLASGNASLWYLYALALYYLYSRIFNRHRIVGTVFVAAIYLALYSTKTDFGWGPNGIIHNAPYFVLGAYWGHLAIEGFRQVHWKIFAPAIAVFAVLTVITTLSGYPFRFLGSIFAMGVVLNLIAHYAGALQRRSTKWLGSLGRHTLSIYVFHRIGVEFMFAAGESTRNLGWADNYLALIAWTVLAPAVAALLLSIVCARLGSQLQKSWPFLFRAPSVKAATEHKTEHNDRFA